MVKILMELLKNFLKYSLNVIQVYFNIAEYFIFHQILFIGFKIVGPEKKICHSKKSWTPEEDVVCVSAAA